MKNMEYASKSLGEIVAADFRTAALFREAGIDFCCGGKMSLGEACRKKGLDPGKFESDITALQVSPIAPSLNYNAWNPGFLADYIVNTHHTYVKKTMPELVAYTEKIARVHGDNHPELREVATLFAAVSKELDQHLRNEEEVLFPAIHALLKGKNDEAAALVRSEIDRMNGEHEFAGGALDQIAVITKGYQVPEDGCTTYRVTMKLLEQFEEDIHVHVHLENNILFPKALSL
ncbi:MAG: iron-sulfur cluster repair di-iron protein [Marinilabiliales bacterium]|nr:iron-sulfur cluster repair di-iron protein [Marinilabiliales bacterium]